MNAAKVCAGPVIFSSASLSFAALAAKDNGSRQILTGPAIFSRSRGKE